MEAQYEPINKDEYLESFSNLKLTEGETNVPLLKPEDISFSEYSWSYKELTKDTKVPIFQNKPGLEQIFKQDNDMSRKLISENASNNLQPYSFYNEKYDVSEVMVFCTGRGIDAGIHIIIKGKVSQKDAEGLVNYLKEKYNFKFDSITGYPVTNDEYMELNWANIQETIMNYFNNK